MVKAPAASALSKPCSPNRASKIPGCVLQQVFALLLVALEEQPVLRHHKRHRAAGRTELEATIQKHIGKIALGAL
jgi:hypothetical protein